MNLRRTITALLVVLGLTFALQSPASAGGVYFGINFEIIGTPQDLQLSNSFRFVTLPIPGVQLGYDFGDDVEGYGARVSLNFFFFGQIALDGYYRFALDANGSNVYVGGGVEYQFLVTLPAAQGAPGLHALGGLEWRPTRNLGVFIEATPGVLLQLPAIGFTVIVRGGLVLHF